MSSQLSMFSFSRRILRSAPSLKMPPWARAWARDFESSRLIRQPERVPQMDWKSISLRAPEKPLLPRVVCRAWNCSILIF